MEAGNQGDAGTSFLTLQLSKLQLHLARVRADSDARLHAAQHRIQQLQQENLVLASMTGGSAHQSVQGWVQDGHVEQPWTSPVLGQHAPCPFTPADIAFVEHEIATLQEQLDAARAKLDFSLGSWQQQHPQASPVSGLVHLPLQHATYTYQPRQHSASRPACQVATRCRSPHSREYGLHGCSSQQHSGSRRIKSPHQSRQQLASPSKHSNGHSESRSRRHRTCRQAIELLHNGLPTMLCQKKRR